MDRSTLSIIVFSKDRPLQLDAYIQSLLSYSGLAAVSVSVLYAESASISYNNLLQKYPSVNWVCETSFHEDLTRLIGESHEYVLFGCDDVFFTGYFDVSTALGCLRKYPDVFGFSLRLGFNLRPRRLPKMYVDNEVVIWEWNDASGRNWSYPWEVSASIYRRDFIAEYLRTEPLAKNPNRLEFYLASSCRKTLLGIGPKFACFKQSKSLTLTINRVQDEFPNEYDNSSRTDILSLYSAHLEGRLLDWRSFYQVQNRLIHVDASYYRTVTSISKLPPRSDTLPRFLPFSWFSNVSIYSRLLVWRCLFLLKAFHR